MARQRSAGQLIQLLENVSSFRWHTSVYSGRKGVRRGGGQGGGGGGEKVGRRREKEEEEGEKMGVARLSFAKAYLLLIARGAVDPVVRRPFVKCLAKALSLGETLVL